MATENKEEIPLAIEETSDGSAVVDLPQGIDVPIDDENDPTEALNKADGGDVDEVDHPDDTEAIRAARRARRRAKKEAIRATNHEKDVRLMQLQRENEENRRRLAELERRTKNSDVMQVNKHIEDAQVRLEYAKMKMAEATQLQDGNALVEAQQLWHDANKEIERASFQKQQIERQGNQAKPNAPQIDPRVQRNAAEWMRRNNWYNPNTSDLDSKIAKQVDDELSNAGYNPTTPEYWDELDNRLQKYLPHRYNGSSNEDSSDRRPRNVVGSSGRETSSSFGGSSKNQFVLSPDRVKAMKDSGAWENPKRKEAMIKYFIEFDRNNPKR